MTMPLVATDPKPIPKGLDVDDSSSVTSRSSSTKAKECFVCGNDKMALTNTKLLVQCIICRRAWHAYCHNPKILNSKDWQCDRCNGKKLPSSSMRASSRSSPKSPGIAPLSGSELCNFSHAKNPYVCGIEGCHSPVFQSAPRPEIKLLCKKHETEERHKIAAAQKRPVIILERPIKKNKLYTYKPDADMGRTLKRKRDFLPKMINSNSSLASKEETTTNRYTQKTKTARAEICHNKLAMFSKARYNATMESVSKATTNLRSIPPPINTDYLMSSLANSHVSPRHHPTMGPVPELAPTAPPHNIVDSTSPGLEDSDSPGLQITQEFKELVEKKNLDSEKGVQPGQIPPIGQNSRIYPPEAIGGQVRSQYTNIVSGHYMHLIEEEDSNQYYQKRNNFAQTAMDAAAGGKINTEKGRSALYNSRIPSLVESSRQQENQQKALAKPHDDQPLRFPNSPSSTDSDLPQQSSSALPPALSSQGIPEKGLLLTWPPVPLSPSITSTELFLDDDFLCQAPFPASLEAKRQEIVPAYDCSGLDSLLATADVVSYREMKDQNWGHIDPRTDWPPDFPETMEEEQEEARIFPDILGVTRPRSKRKANFRKLLTRQTVRHREHERWDIHQSKALPSEKLVEGAALLEDLFGIRDIDDLEPGMNSGKLGMKRKTPAPGERRKEADFFYQLECG